LQGIAYIKFYKTSEAAYAMEEMNGRCIGSDPRPLKVLIAHARDQVTIQLNQNTIENAGNQRVDFTIFDWSINQDVTKKVLPS
jgi:hypothetical protein